MDTNRYEFKTGHGFHRLTRIGDESVPIRGIRDSRFALQPRRSWLFPASFQLCAGLAVWFWVAASISAAEPGAEFFEQRIRPVLAGRCYKCHSAGGEKIKGGLVLDTREGMLKGGDTRPALVPGNPEKSLLIEAIHYTNEDLKMPPKGKLSPQEIADFVAWVKNGAEWPKDIGPKAASVNQNAQLRSARNRRLSGHQPRNFARFAPGSALA